MKLRGIPLLYRRAILIYFGAIVAPVCGLVWLGLESFERQRQSLASLTAEKLANAVETRTRAAAATALAKPGEPIAQYSFIWEHGVVTRPALHAAPPAPLPRTMRLWERMAEIIAKS
jgi:hypothetical protein